MSFENVLCICKSIISNMCCITFNQITKCKSISIVYYINQNNFIPINNALYIPVHWKIFQLVVYY